MGKKFLALFLALILSSVAVVSCTTGTADPTRDTKNQQETAAEVTAAESAQPTKKWGNLPYDLRLDGYEFKIATYVDGNVSVYWANYFDVDEPEPGDILQIAANLRNSKIEEDLGCEITCDENWHWFGNKEGYEYMNTMVASSDPTYDMYFLEGYINLAPLLLDDCLYDMATLPYIDLEADYYNHDHNDTYHFGDSQYLLCSDMTYPCQNCVQFIVNKDHLVDIFHDENYVYDLVDSGNWTFDKVFEMVEGQYSDLNSNNERDEFDYYGFAGAPQAAAPFFPGAGMKGTYLTDTGFEFDYGTDRAVKVVDRIVEFMGKQEVFTKYWNTPIFSENRALFTTHGAELRELRNWDFNYGIVPIPKFDDEQNRYYSYTNGGTFVLPSCLEEPEKVGALIEAMSYGSQQYLVPAFYENFIEQKVLQDDKSREYWAKMLTEYSSREFTYIMSPSEDLRYFGPAYQAIDGVGNGNANNFVTRWDTVKFAARIVFDQFYEAYFSKT